MNKTLFFLNERLLIMAASAPTRKYSLFGRNSSVSVTAFQTTTSATLRAKQA